VGAPDNSSGRVCHNHQILQRSQHSSRVSWNCVPQLRRVSKSCSLSEFSEVDQWKIRRQNALQIKELANLKQFSYDKNLFNAAFQEDDVVKSAESLGEFIRSVKDPLINFKKFPTSSLILIAILVLCFQVGYSALESN
jgi:hypothetical protein